MKMLKEKKKVKLPDEIENLFRYNNLVFQSSSIYIFWIFFSCFYFDLLSLMDFAHDEKISEGEFLRATGHYRSGQYNMPPKLLVNQSPILFSELTDLTCIGGSASSLPSTRGTALEKVRQHFKVT